MVDCYLCGQESYLLPEADQRFFAVGCRGCGDYSLARDLARDLVAALDAGEKQRLRWRVRESTDSGERLVISVENAKRLADVPVPPVPAKLFRLLEELARRSLFAGDWVDLEFLPTLVRLKCEVPGELAYLSDALIERGLIARNDGPRELLQVTAKGWETLVPIGGAGVPGVCFVAMAFAPELNDAYDTGMLPAIETDCGLRALRLDREEHNDQITDRILAGIRSAQIVIADVTLHRQNVYYEAGFAQGLGRVVIRTCRAEAFKDVHFDTRQFSHVVWESPADLRAKLSVRLKATVGVPVRFSI